MEIQFHLAMLNYSLLLGPNSMQSFKKFALEEWPRCVPQKTDLSDTVSTFGDLTRGAFG